MISETSTLKTCSSHTQKESTSYINVRLSGFQAREEKKYRIEKKVDSKKLIQKKVDFFDFFLISLISFSTSLPKGEVRPRFRTSGSVVTRPVCCVF